MTEDQKRLVALGAGLALNDAISIFAFKRGLAALLDRDLSWGQAFWLVATVRIIGASIEKGRNSEIVSRDAIKDKYGIHS